MTQLSLLRDDTKSKTIIFVPVGKLAVSPFNPRQTRSDASIQKLADRIERNGFEVTRALWAYANNGHYEVFAGGNRLEAVKRTSIAEVPVVLHEGYTEDEITRLADEDNENDEYHDSVPIVDVWMDYKRLADMGWTPKRISDAKGVTLSTVSARMKYSCWPAKVISAFFKNDFLKESHAAEIYKISNFENLAPWLTWEQAAIEVIDAALKKGGTAKHFADVVGIYNGFISIAQDCAEKLDSAWRTKFVDLLVTNNVRSKASVTSAYAKVHDDIVIAAKREEAKAAQAADEAEARRKALELEAELNRRIETQIAKVVHGDSREQLSHAPDGIALLLTDPPYGQDFQSNRRVVKAKADKIANDTDVAFDLLADVLRIAYPKMANDSHVLVWSSWRYECEFRQIIQDAGYEIRGSLIWNKPNHGSGDLTGSFAPKHERIIHAVKGNPKLRNRPDDVLSGNKFTYSEHPTEKPVDLLQVLIEATTDEGDLVADPFAGAGSAVIAAYKSNRDFWACELDDKWWQFTRDLVYENVKAEVSNG